MEKYEIKKPVFEIISTIPINLKYKELIYNDSSLLEAYLEQPVDSIDFPVKIMNIFKENGFKNIKDVVTNLKESGQNGYRLLGDVSCKKISNIISEDLEQHIDNRNTGSDPGQYRKTSYNKVLAMTEGILGIACKEKVDVISKIIEKDGGIDNFMNTSVDSLNVSSKNERVLGGVKVENIGDLGKINVRRLMLEKAYGEKSLSNLIAGIQKFLDIYLNELSTGFSRVVQPNNLEELVKYMLSKISQKEAHILSRRFGLWDGKRETLAGIGGVLGLSRERVRQLQNKAVNKLRRTNWIRVVGRVKQTDLRDDHLQAFMKKLFDAKLYPFLKQNEGVASKSELAHIIYTSCGESVAVDLANEFLSETFFGGKVIFSDFVVEFSDEVVGLYRDDMNVFLKVVNQTKECLQEKGVPMGIDELVDYFRGKGLNRIFNISHSRLKRYITLSSIPQDSTGKFGLRQWEYFDSYTIKCMLERALIEIGQPAHFTKIAEVVNDIFKKYGPFDAHSLHARLGTVKEIFTWIYPGVYGLKKWGIKRVPNIKDFIIELLRVSNKPMTIDQLTEKIRQKRTCSRASVYATVCMNKDIFLKYKENTYGLKEWDK